MSEPLSFLSSSVNLQLPFLFPGQAQKEIFVNQAFAMIDTLMPRTVTATLAGPPASAADGESYVVAGTATGEWTGMENAIAIRLSGGWQFVTPKEGMMVFDRDAGQILIFRSEWEAAQEPAAPNGGAVVDVELRAAFLSLINGLKTVGILPTA